MIGFAYLLGEPSQKMRGEAYFYRLEPPFKDNDAGVVEYVIVSAVHTPIFWEWDQGCETYIFPATEDGRVQSFMELDGSCKGVWDHVAVLHDMGYAVIDPEPEPDNRGLLLTGPTD